LFCKPCKVIQSSAFLLPCFQTWAFCGTDFPHVRGAGAVEPLFFFCVAQTFFVSRIKRPPFMFFRPPPLLYFGSLTVLNQFLPLGERLLHLPRCHITRPLPRDFRKKLPGAPPFFPSLFLYFFDHLPLFRPLDFFFCATRSQGCLSAPLFLPPSLLCDFGVWSVTESVPLGHFDPGDPPPPPPPRFGRPLFHNPLWGRLVSSGH